MRAFWAAVSRVNGGKGGRDILISQLLDCRETIVCIDRVDGLSPIDRLRASIEDDRDHDLSSAFINARIDFGIGCALPSLINATRTSAVTSTSVPRRTSCASAIEAPFTATGQVTTSSTSSIRAGLRKSIFIERTTNVGGRLSLGFRKQGVLLGAHQPQMVGAAAFHVAQIIGVIDDAGKIRVLVIDADLHVMPAVTDFAVEMR